MWKVFLLNKIKVLCLKKNGFYFIVLELEENYLDVFKVEYFESKIVISLIYFYLQKLCNDDELKFFEFGNYEYLNFEKNEFQMIIEEIVEESVLLLKFIYVFYDISYLVQDGCFLEEVKI